MQERQKNIKNYPCWLIALLLSCLLAFSQAVAAEPECDSCRKRQRTNCSYKCDRSGSQSAYDRCLRECLSHVCAKHCPKSINTPSRPTSTEAACRQCLDREEGGGCLQECPLGAPRSGACRKRCAKRKCTNVCTLPDVQKRSSHIPGQFDCEHCKEQMTYVCQTGNMCNRNLPGALACQFKCVQDRCASACATVGEEEE